MKQRPTTQLKVGGEKAGQVGLRVCLLSSINIAGGCTMMMIGQTSGVNVMAIPNKAVVIYKSPWSWIDPVCLSLHDAESCC